ncbi:hypothetical protein PAXRUDRAFT_129640 [Paxillus rubicundulus Ve08.2h10]|uniref:Unplaced genomic scaffold scaffold_10, whole genome shotgun sequence n=1 Tax=Paxillus rubicundulus Ve08.2h10 TaxID=930991 RepID=A0A0D0DXZ0_9AGAM|nr:hypothetical protein PAXRUDRAFT_129640 [Paxillus rubicundulus Ve08.2h10]
MNLTALTCTVVVANDERQVTLKQHTTMQTLPVELLAEIFSELDLESLITVSSLSRRLRSVTSDPSLNPWRRPILHNLRHGIYEKCFYHLGSRSIVPRQNWIPILTFASPSFLLFESTLPNLKSSEWEESFRRRFLPGWVKWKENSWRVAFMKVLYRVWHRTRSACTSDESWTKYIVLNRNGSVNELEASSRTFNPLAVFNAIKTQNNLAHLPTQIRVVLELIDARIIVLGVLDRPRTSLTVNPNAQVFLRPPGARAARSGDMTEGGDVVSNRSDLPASRVAETTLRSKPVYDRIYHPMPSPLHYNYPMYTPGGGDRRWFVDIREILGEEAMQWVGGLMVTVQLRPHAQGLDTYDIQELAEGISHSHFASFTWQDFLAIAPWMEERITKFIHGQGLGSP